MALAVNDDIFPYNELVMRIICICVFISMTKTEEAKARVTNPNMVVLPGLFTSSNYLNDC